MTTLYPRLLPNETDALFRQLHERTLREMQHAAAVQSEHAVFAASGGTRVAADHLDGLRLAIRQEADSVGYPDPPSARARADFDSATARILVTQTDMAPGEAAQPQVWAFLALVVMPHICAWRFPPRPDGTYVADRFKGTDLTRHALGRLWTRAFTLREPRAVRDADAFRLLDVLGEADLDQIMARRDSVAASPALVRSIVRTYDEGLPADSRIPARRVLRETLIRILRLLAFLDVDGYDDDALDGLVREIRAQAIADLEGALLATTSSQ